MVKRKSEIEFLLLVHYFDIVLMSGMVLLAIFVLKFGDRITAYYDKKHASN